MSPVTQPRRAPSGKLDVLLTILNLGNNSPLPAAIRVRRRGLRQAVHGPLVTAEAREDTPSSAEPPVPPRRPDLPRQSPAEARGRPAPVPRQASHAQVHSGQAQRAQVSETVRKLVVEQANDAVSEVVREEIEVDRSGFGGW